MMNEICALALSTLRPPEMLSPEVWAEKYYVLSSKNSAQPGPFRIDAQPAIRGPLQAMGHKDIRKLTLMTSAQVFKSEVLNIGIGWSMHMDPCPMLMAQPKKEAAEAYMRTRIRPMVEQSPVLKDLVDFDGKRSGNTLTYIGFGQGFLKMVGTQSATDLASQPVKKTFSDEVDRWEGNVGKEGDPQRLIEKRSQTFWNSLNAAVSTPGLKGLSRIEKRFSQSDQRHFHVVCGHCGCQQKMDFDQIRYADDDPSTALYQCAGPDCGTVWTDHERKRFIRQSEAKGGGWKADKPDVAGHAGFAISQLCSMFSTLSEIVAEYLECRDDPALYQTFVNTVLGLPYEPAQGAPVDPPALRRRALHNRWWADMESVRHLPDGAAYVTGAGDVQADRLEFQTVAWGRGGERWILDQHVIYINPFNEQAWSQLDEYIEQPFIAPNGDEVFMEGACMDSGDGGTTQEVYAWTARHKLARIPRYAIKGVSGNQRLLWERSPTTAFVKRLNEKVSLERIGVDVAKTQVYAHLGLEQPGKPNYIHLPGFLAKSQEPKPTPDFFDQIVAEMVVTKYRKGHPYREWHKPSGVNNEALDCHGYNVALNSILSINVERRLEQFAETAADRLAASDAVGSSGMQSAADRLRASLNKSKS